MLSVLVGVLFITGATRPILALSVDDYFTYTYSFVFSKTNIIGSETFMVMVSGQAICVQDLPLPVSTASVVSKVVARHTKMGTEIILNPRYSIRYDSGFPSQKGQTASASVQVPLSFPNGSPAGVYDITGQILEAKVSVLVITIDVAGYLPSTQTMGTVTYTPSNTGGSGGGTVAPTTPSTPTTTTPSTTTTTVIPSTTPPTSSTPETVIPSSTPPAIVIPLSPVSPASFLLSDLTVTPTVVTNGKTLTITVLLSNTGDLSGTYEVIMKMDGQVANSQSIKLAGKSSQVVTFNHLVSIEGQHIVTIGGLSKEFLVNAPQLTAKPFKLWLVGGLAGLGLGLVIGCSIIFASRRKKSEQ
jgi:hypothetical protein